MKKPLTNEESSAIILGQSKIWCSSQVVRPRSATPLSAGSNPACTSKEKWDSVRDPIFSFLWRRRPRIWTDRAFRLDGSNLKAKWKRLIIVFTTLYTAKQGVYRAERTEAIANDYATGATLHLTDPQGRFFYFITHFFAVIFSPSFFVVSIYKIIFLW